MDALLIKGLGLPKEGCHHTLSIYADGSVEIGSKKNYSAIQLPTHSAVINLETLPVHLHYFDTIIRKEDLVDNMIFRNDDEEENNG